MPPPLLSHPQASSPQSEGFTNGYCAPGIAANLTVLGDNIFLKLKPGGQNVKYLYDIRAVNYPPGLHW